MLLVPLATTAGLWLTGHALLAAFRPGRARGVVERHATALVLGLAGVPALYAGAVIVAGPLPGVVVRVALGVASLVGALALALGWSRGAASARPLPAEPPPSPLARLGIAAVIALAVFGPFHGLSQPTKSFDATYHFAYKGKLVHGEGIGTEAWTDLSGPIGRVHTHVTYPPAIPALHALVANVGGRFDEHATRPLFALYMIAAAGLLWGALRTRGRGAALTGSLLWISLPFLWFSGIPYRAIGPAVKTFVLGPDPSEARYFPQGYMLDGAADMPLAALLFAGFVHAWRIARFAREEHDRADAWIAGIALGGAVLTKNEGLALLLVVPLALGLAALFHRHSAERPLELGRAAFPPVLGIAIALVVTVALAAPWIGLRGSLPDVDENYPRAIAALPSELHRFERTGDIVRGFTNVFLPFVNIEVETFLRWVLLWPLFLAAIGWNLRRPGAFLRHPALPAVLVVLGGTWLYALILLTTPWDLDELFATLIPDRLVLHYTPIGIFATAALLWRRSSDP